MRVVDIDFDNILLDKKSYKTYKDILIHEISYKTFMVAKPSYIRFNEIDGFIKIYDGIRYLVLFGSGWYDAIYNRIRYLISKRHSITDSNNHNFASSKLIHIILYQQTICYNTNMLYMIYQGGHFLEKP